MTRLLCGLVALLLAAAAGARTLIVHADGRAIAADGGIRRFSGLLIGDDGRVAAVLRRGEPEPKLGPGDYRLDAGGRTLLPGFIDADAHLMALGLRLRAFDLSPATSIADIRQRVRDRAAATPAAQWIVGRGWNEGAWGGAFPTAADLDAAAPGRPVWLLRAGGDAGWASPAALKAAGIGAGTPDPPGGRIVRGPAGAPNGILVGAAMALMPVPAPGAGEREQALAAALKLLGSLGVTGVHDMGTSAADWALYRAFGDEGRLSLRITAYADGMAAIEAIAPLRPTPPLYDGRLRLVGVRLRADRSAEVRGAWLRTPYADAPAESGIRLLDDARMKNLFSRANFLGFQVAVEAAGDAAVTQVLDSLAEIRPAYGGKYRNRLEGPILVDPADLPRLKALETIPVLRPALAAAPVLGQRLGPERMAAAGGWPAIASAAGVFALGSGFPAAPVAPFSGIAAAVAAGGHGLTVAQALAGYTRGGAFAGHAEQEVGSLEPGQWADFILVDRDPFAVPAAELGGIDVLETWVAGRRVFQRPQP